MSAAAKTNEKPIIIVKRKKGGGHGHHGGAWKVAYADFVTAMMAFFMVMWLISSVNKEQRAAIFDYFKNPSMEQGTAPKPAPGQNGPGGASTSLINLHGGLDDIRRPPTTVRDRLAKSKPVPKAGLGMGPGQLSDEEKDKLQKQAIEQEREAEHKQLQALMQQLETAIDTNAALRPFKNQLLLDITPEGVRIQIVDAQNRPMFDVGSAKLRDYTTAILTELAKYLASVPNRISLTGHTDIRPYAGKVGYSNWELSADRANAARRALVGGGLPGDKIARVVGLSSSVLFNKDEPEDPINRRISIVVMTKKAEEDAMKTDTAASSEVPSGAPAAATTAAIAASVAAAAPPAPVASKTAPTAATATAPPAANAAPVPTTSVAAAVAAALGKTTRK